MKIEPTNSTTEVTQATNRSNKSNEASGQTDLVNGTPPTNAVVDTISITSSLQQIENGNNVAQTFDAKKVKEIQTALAEGKLSFDINKIADKLIETAKELLKP